MNNGLSGKYIEPPLQRGRTFNERFRWWYSSIADLMIREPEITQVEIAARLKKHPNTISMIVGTDMFREYFHQRREAYRIDHDHALRVRMTQVATEGLDIVLDQLRTKKTQIPLQVALEVVESSLDRLGYAPSSGPQVVVNNNPDNRQQTVVNVSASDLEAARAAMRVAEQSKAGSSLAPPAVGLPPTLDALEACGVGQDVLDVEVSGSSGSQP